MKDYGWDHFTFESQPAWVIDLAIQKMTIEAKLAAKAAEQPKYAQ